VERLRPRIAFYENVYRKTLREILEEHDDVMKRYGLDRHTASAYLIALRGIERHSMI